MTKKEIIEMCMRDLQGEVHQSPIIRNLVDRLQKEYLQTGMPAFTSVTMIKKCPFCGSFNTVYKRTHEINAMGGNEVENIIQCGECKQIARVKDVYSKDVGVQYVEASQRLAFGRLMEMWGDGTEESGWVKRV